MDHSHSVQLSGRASCAHLPVWSLPGCAAWLEVTFHCSTVHLAVPTVMDKWVFLKARAEVYKNRLVFKVLGETWCYNSFH